ncbi:MAG: DUF1018 domain-containing protein [Peptostreptococcaceae bacterium]|nr:DUF1018 domain-containing protein [Peptostreptococcaceae bacterium]
MYKITKSQIQNLYAIASKIGILESGNKDDSFHALVYQMTNKKSVSDLSGMEYYKVRDRLLEIQGSDKNNDAKVKTKKKNKDDTKATEGMTQGQCSKVWYLMYEFEKASPSHATVGERLKGIIKRQLNIDVDVKKPFVWLTHKQGNQLIEILKKYVANAKDKSVDIEKVK